MNGFLQGIAGLCLIRVILDMALPEGETGEWASLGVELSMMLCMLRFLMAMLGWNG